MTFSFSRFFANLSPNLFLSSVLPSISRILVPCSWQRGLILIDLSGGPARRKVAIFDISTARPGTIRYRGTGRDNEMIDHAGDPTGSLARDTRF